MYYYPFHGKILETNLSRARDGVLKGDPMPRTILVTKIVVTSNQEYWSNLISLATCEKKQKKTVPYNTYITYITNKYCDPNGHSRVEAVASRAKQSKIVNLQLTNQIPALH